MKRFIPLLFLFLCFGCTGGMSNSDVNDVVIEDGRNTSWGTPVSAEGLPNLFKVSDELYRSAQPTNGGLTTAKTMGIQTVISLRETPVDIKLEAKEKTGLNLIHIPIKTWNITDANIMDVLIQYRDAPKPILIHCRHGADRTGFMTALYRIVVQGWDKDAAKKELLEGGYGFHTIWSNIPDSIDSLDPKPWVDVYKKQ